LICNLNFFIWYKIKNSEGKTHGYLFGTIHELEQKALLSLHPKIFSCLEKCKSLFVEMNFYDFQRLSSEMKNNIWLSELDDDEVYKIIERVKSEVFAQPIAIEDILIKYADTTCLEINSLETDDSRYRAAAFTTNGKKALEAEQWETSAFAIEHAADKLIAIVHASKEEKPAQLCEAYQALIDAIKNVNFKTDIANSSLEKLQVKTNLKNLIRAYELIFTSIDEEKGKSWMATARDFYTALQQFDEGVSPVFEKWRHKIQKAYIRGDKNMRTEYPNKGNLIDRKIKALELKELVLRDEFILTVMQDNLKQSNENKRNFYAVGSAHLLDNYDNLCVMLEKKGWKIIDAYK
jgi:hypothetical protein